MILSLLSHVIDVFVVDAISHPKEVLYVNSIPSNVDVCLKDFVFFLRLIRDNFMLKVYGLNIGTEMGYTN